MATIPDRIEEAVEALIAKIQAEEPTATVEWVLDDSDPTETSDADDWANPDKSLYYIVVLGLNTDSTKRQVGRGSGRRWQTGSLIVRSNIWDRTKATLAQSQIRQARRIQNWIEDLDDRGSKRNSRQWWIDHTGWEGIRDETGKAPTPGLRVTCELGVNQ